MVKKARYECLLQHLVGNALICYGLPVRVRM